LFALAALLVTVTWMSHGGPLVHLWHHIGFLPLLSVVMALIGWLVIQAHDAQSLQPCQTCRRR
jgi:hypothetical protein